MRTQVLLIALILWGCEGLLEEETASTLSESSGDAVAESVIIGVQMVDSSAKTRDAYLRIQRDSSGNPACLDLLWGNDGANSDTTQYTVPLEKRGEGEWRVAASSTNADATYDRYQRRANSTAVLHITLHWIKKRGSIFASNLSNATGRLEYLAARLGDTSNTYTYHKDDDGKSGLAVGNLLQQNVSDKFTANSGCEAST